MIIRELINLFIQKDEASIDTSTTEVFHKEDQKDKVGLFVASDLWDLLLSHG